MKIFISIQVRQINALMDDVRISYVNLQTLSFLVWKWQWFWVDEITYWASFGGLLYQFGFKSAWKIF